MVAADADERLREVELVLGVKFPDDYREFVCASDKLVGDFGGSYLALYSLDEIVALNHGYEMTETFPSLVLIGSDGGGEAVGFDFRRSPPCVVLVNFVSAGWHEAVRQTGTFSGFIAQLESGEGYKFDM